MAASPDPARAERVRELLEGTEAEGYLDAPHQICFSVHGPAVVTEDGNVLLPRDGRDHALAARLGHLLEHVVHPTLPDDDSSGCEVRVHRALEREASAYALEIRLRDRFELDTAPFVDVEAAYRAEGEQGILSWLEANPEGGRGVDALGRSYRERCEAEQ